MKKELRKVYKNVQGERSAKLNAIRWQYPTSQHDPVWFKNDIEYMVEKLIEKSKFGKIRSEVSVGLKKTDRSVLYGNGADMDIKEYGLVEYAENFFEKNLRKFGKAEVKLGRQWLYYGQPYYWEASFEPNKSQAL